MSRRIQEDHREFYDIISGKLRDELKKYINRGKLLTLRPDGKKGKYVINLPHIDIPTIRFGRNDKGIGRGEGEPGDIIGKDPGKSKGPGNTHGNAMPVGITLEHILNFLKEELELPNIKPKQCDKIYKEYTKYNGIRKVGPESLRHNYRTMRQTMLRMIQLDDYDYNNPVLIPIQDDKRYRSWNIKKIEDSNAVIFYMRDWSGSMDDNKCDIVSNCAWWIDCWIRQFYKRTESIYIGHDTEAEEVDQDKFYKFRYGGGTIMSSAFELLQEMIKFRFQPNKWNIYVFYFSDLEIWGDDLTKTSRIIRENQENINLLGLCGITFDSYFVDANMSKNFEGLEKEYDNVLFYEYKNTTNCSEIEVIKKFLGKNKNSANQESE